MSIEEENKAVVLRYFEESNLIQGDSSKVHTLVGKFLAPEFVAHHSIGGDMNLASNPLGGSKAFFGGFDSHALPPDATRVALFSHVHFQAS